MSGGSAKGEGTSSVRKIRHSGAGKGAMKSRWHSERLVTRNITTDSVANGVSRYALPALLMYSAYAAGPERIAIIHRTSMMCLSAAYAIRGAGGRKGGGEGKG